MSDVERLEQVEALVLYCRKLLSQIAELREETAYLKEEIRRLKGSNGRIYEIDPDRIQILKGRIL